jgi:exopolysaccharide production protein ExoZ
MQISGTSGPREVVSVQYLRGLAAMLVVTWHAQGQMGLTETTFFQGGIEVFFLISGYIMWMTTAARNMTPKDFALRRIARVIPLYWALTTVVVLMLIFAPRFAQHTRFDLAHIIASYLFIPWPNPAPGAGLKPLIIPGWTLNYEVFFYVVFGLSLFLPRKWRGWVLFGILAVLTSAAPFSSHLPFVAAFYASPLVVDFGIGVLIAMAIERTTEKQARYGIRFFVAGCILMIIGGSLMDHDADFRLFWVTPPAVLIVGGAALWESRFKVVNLPILHAIGNASYSLYLIHPLLLSVMAQLWKRYLPGAPPEIFVIVALAGMCAGGLVLYQLVEKPLTDALHKVLIKRRPRVAITSPVTAA